MGKSQGTYSWQGLKLTEGKSTAGATLTANPDHSIIVTGPLTKDTYTLTFDTDLADVTGLRIEALADQTLPSNGPGRAPNGNFVLNELTLSVANSEQPDKPTKLQIFGNNSTFSQQNYQSREAIDGDPTPVGQSIPSWAKIKPLLTPSKVGPSTN